jgi:predicted SprT family Zn-dependent metalloprotease
VQNSDRFLSTQRRLPSIGDLQLLFSRMNAVHFRGEVPAYRIAFNARLTSVAGRITYRPPLIELSISLLSKHPSQIEHTLLHEMVHAWLHARKLPCGHGRHFEGKMREVGLKSIYHPMPVPHRRSRRRYLLTCPRCKAEFVRRRNPGGPVSCARCSPAHYDPRVRMLVRDM